MILEGLRHNIARIFLRKRAAKLKRHKMLYDFASAKHIGILCAPQDEVSTVHLKEFLHTLSRKGIKYSVFGYFNEKRIPENFLYLKDMDFITHQDLNFLFIPKSPTVTKFIQEPFDMLINCCLFDYFPVRYMSQLSMAKCKVGIMREDESIYDLTIDIKKNKTIEYFLKNIEKYLSNLTFTIIQT